MIQNLTTIKDQIDKLNMIIGDKAQIQKIYSTSIFFVLSLRIPGQTLYLYCGRGAGYEGIYWSDSPPAPILRKKDKFIEYLRKYLSSCYISRFCCDEKDRVWIIE